MCENYNPLILEASEIPNKHITSMASLWHVLYTPRSSLRLRVSVAYRCSLTALPPRLASWRYLRGQRSLLVNFAIATGGGLARGSPLEVKLDSCLDLGEFEWFSVEI